MPYFFNYFMDLEQPANILDDRKWYTTNIDDADRILGMTPINSNSPLEAHMKKTKKYRNKDRYGAEEFVNTNLSYSEFTKIQNEINRQIDNINKGRRVENYFYDYNNFSGNSDPYLFNARDIINRAVRKNKSTNLLTLDKSRLPSSLKQSFKIANGTTVNGLAFIENVIDNVQPSIDENAANMENR